MIRVKVTYHENVPERIELSGHAMYDEYGKDIVCSAASSIFITTVNGILSFDPTYIKVEEEQDKLIVSVLVKNEITKTLIQNMLNLFTDLATNYPKNVKIS